MSSIQFETSNNDNRNEKHQKALWVVHDFILQVRSYEILPQFRYTHDSLAIFPSNRTEYSPKMKTKPNFRSDTNDFQYHKNVLHILRKITSQVDYSLYECGMGRAWNKPFWDPVLLYSILVTLEITPLIEVYNWGIGGHCTLCKYLFCAVLQY